MTEFEKLLNALTQHAYDTGYYSGKGEDGQPHHVRAMEDRELVRKKVLAIFEKMNDDWERKEDELTNAEEEIAYLQDELDDLRS